VASSTRASYRWLGQGGFVQYLKEVLVYVLTIYLVVLIGRMIFSWVQVFARDWRPSGILLVIAEGIFTITDPPLKLLRRFIPTLRIGMVAMDLSFMVLFIVILILLEVVVPRL
jgi:YggT family protein